MKEAENRMQETMAKMKNDLKEMVKKETANAAPPPTTRASPPRMFEK
jgi:hypothetical protein